MLSNADYKNLECYNKLKPSHKRVFKHRLRKKTYRAIKELILVLLTFDELNLNFESLFDAKDFEKFVETYTLLQRKNYCKKF